MKTKITLSNTCLQSLAWRAGFKTSQEYIDWFLNKKPKNHQI